MKKIYLLLISLLFSVVTLGSCALEEKELTESEIQKELRPSIVKVECYDAAMDKVLTQGSGFFIDKKGTFVTNYHVIENSYYVKITDYNRRSKWVKTINCCENKISDYAICSVEASLNSQPVTFSSNINKEDKIYAYGFPNGVDSPVFSNGEIIEKEVEEDSIKYIKNTATIDHGSSGGVLINKYGHVIGITTCEFKDTSFGAIPYSSFQSKLTNKSVNKDPLNYFHKVQNVMVSTATFNEYFYYTYTSSTAYIGSYVSFNYRVGVKGNYINKIYPNNPEQYSPTIVSVKLEFKVYYSTSISTYKTQYKNITMTYKDINSTKFGTESVYLSTFGSNKPTITGTEMNATLVTGSFYVID